MKSVYTDAKGIQHNDPPSIFDLTDRATAFRERAALPAVDHSADSNEFRAQIMSLLPDGATNIRSLGRDRTDEEIDALRRDREANCAERRKKSKEVREVHQTLPNAAGSVNAASDHDNRHGSQHNDNGSPFISADEMGPWTNIPEGPIMHPSLPQTPINPNQWVGNGPQRYGPGQGQGGLNQRVPYGNMPTPLQTPPYTNGSTLPRYTYAAPNMPSPHPTPQANSNPNVSSMGPPPAPQNAVKRSLKRSLPEAERSPSPPKRQRTQNVPSSQEAVWDHQRRALHMMEQGQNGNRASAVGGAISPPGSSVLRRTVNGQSTNGHIVNQQPINSQAAQVQRSKRRLEEVSPEAEEAQRPGSPKRQRKGKEVETREDPTMKKGSRVLHQPKGFYKKVENPAVNNPASSSVVLEPSHDFYGKPRRRVRDSRSRGQQPVRYILVNKTERNRAHARNKLLRDALMNFSSGLGHTVPPRATSAQLNPEIIKAVEGLQDVPPPSRANQSAFNGQKDSTGTVHTNPHDGPSTATAQQIQPAANMGSPNVNRNSQTQSQSNSPSLQDDAKFTGPSGNNSTQTHDVSKKDQPRDVAKHVDPKNTTLKPMEDTSYLASGISDAGDLDYTGFEEFDFRAEVNVQPSVQNASDNAVQVQGISSAAPPSVNVLSEQPPPEAGPRDTGKRDVMPTVPPTDASVDELPSEDLSSPSQATRPDQPASKPENPNQQPAVDPQPTNQSTSDNAPQPQSNASTPPPSVNDILDETQVAMLRDYLEREGEPSLDVRTLDDIFRDGGMSPLDE